MNERKNPAAVAKATSAPPSRKASGMRVSVREASTAPPANDRRRECKPPSEPGRTVPPATTAAARSRAVADQTRITNPLERPWSRSPTAPPRASGRLEAKMATRSARDPAPCSRETPRAKFSGDAIERHGGEDGEPRDTATRALYVTLEQPVSRHKGRGPYQEPDPREHSTPSVERHLEQIEGEGGDQGPTGEGQRHGDQRARRSPEGPRRAPDNEGARSDQTEYKRLHHRASAAIPVGRVLTSRHGDYALHPTLVHPHLARDLSHAHPRARETGYLLLEADLPSIFHARHHPSELSVTSVIPAPGLASLTSGV